MASNQIAIHYIYVYIYILYIYIFLDPKGSDSWLERTGCRTVDRVFLGVAHQSLGFEALDVVGLFWSFGYGF